MLTETDRPRKYWNDLKAKLKKEGSELSEKIGQLKMLAADGKMRSTDESSFRMHFSSVNPTIASGKKLNFPLDSYYAHSPLMVFTLKQINHVIF